MTEIIRKSNGQIVVKGTVTLTDEHGTKLEHGPRFTLCGCGKTGTPPFCNGAHNG